MSSETQKGKGALFWIRSPGLGMVLCSPGLDWLGSWLHPLGSWLLPLHSWLPLSVLGSFLRVHGSTLWVILPYSWNVLAVYSWIILSNYFLPVGFDILWYSLWYSLCPFLYKTHKFLHTIFAETTFLKNFVDLALISWGFTPLDKIHTHNHCWDQPPSVFSFSPASFLNDLCFVWEDMWGTPLISWKGPFVVWQKLCCQSHAQPFLRDTIWQPLCHLVPSGEAGNFLKISQSFFLFLWNSSFLNSSLSFCILSQVEGENLMWAKLQQRWRPALSLPSCDRNEAVFSAYRSGNSEPRNTFPLPWYGRYNFDTKPDEDIIIKKNYSADIPQEPRCKMIANQTQHCIERIISHDRDGFIL